MGQPDLIENNDWEENEFKHLYEYKSLDCTNRVMNVHPKKCSRSEI